MKRENASNNEKAAAFVKKMNDYVDDAVAGRVLVPMRHGQVNVSAVAKKLGFARERFHSNKFLENEMSRLRAFMGDSPDQEINSTHSDKEIKALETRIKALEKALFLKTMELEAIREDNFRKEHAEEHLLRTGRVVHPYQGRSMKGTLCSANG
jgi:predicted RNase H-like nuclease (RuvC/YqgF family)